MKNYSEITFLNKLQKIKFLNYYNFDDINAAYSDFMNRVEITIDDVAPLKIIYIKIEPRNGMGLHMYPDRKQANHRKFIWANFSFCHHFY